MHILGDVIINVVVERKKKNKTSINVKLKSKEV
jgi:hypothetical protein